MTVLDISFEPPPKPKPRGANMTADELEKVRQRNLSIASALRSGGRSQAAIAKAFGVSRSTVSIVNNEQVLGRPTRKERQKSALVAGSPAMVAVEQAERALRQAQRNVLIAEAVLHEAHAQLARERAEAMA